MNGKMRVLYLPLDERPCNYAFAHQIACETPVELLEPEKQLLGEKKKPADFDGLREFLLENAQADACVLSLDMLLYGGIVPSRLHDLTEDALRQRLEVLRQMKQKNPTLKLFGFSLIMRCPCYSSADEEPDYYETCGREIFLTGQVKHKQKLGLISDWEAKELLSLYAEKTGPYLQDFEQRRKKNLWVLEQLLTEYYDLFDVFVIPQDDSSAYGYTTMDREHLKQLQRQLGLPEVPMYPGADEVGMSLMANAVCCLLGRTPKVYLDFVHADGAKVVPVYEDRPVGKTLPLLLGTSGCRICVTREEADIILYLNYPASDPVEIFDPPTQGYAVRDLRGFTDRIVRDIRAGQVAALADGAYCNGGDPELLKLIAGRLDLTELSAYAGWNTSSNTLGTAVCQAVFVWLFGHSDAQRKFIAQRLYEDVGYCGVVRREVTALLEPLGYGYFDAGEKEGVVAGMVRQHLQDYMDAHFPELTQKYVLDRCQMPWKRMFEVDLTVRRI